MRLKEYSENIPKPMVKIGYRPILWHVMRYYAYFGHKDFILCLGYKADEIKKYFLEYDETISNDFVMSKGGANIELLNSDIQEWKITFVDTGLSSNIGQRLMAVQHFLENEDIFMANYTDGLSDVNLDSMLNYFLHLNKIACFLSVKPTQSFHLVTTEDNGLVQKIKHIRDSGMSINGGFFIFRNKIFDYIKNGEELVEEPFHRLIHDKQLVFFLFHS